MATKLGIHVFPGSREGFLEVCSANPALIVVSGDRSALDEAHKNSGDGTITVFRDTTVYQDAPPGAEHMTESGGITAAELFWPRLMEVYQEVSADYYQPLRAPVTDSPAAIEGLAAFEWRLMELAERDGYHLAIGNLASGAPFTWQRWVDHVVPLIRRAAKGKHLYSRRAHGGVVLGSNGKLTGPGPVPADNIAGRPFREAAFLQEKGIITPIIITEAGQNGGLMFPGTDEFMADVNNFDLLCRQYNNIWGFCCWTYGRYQNYPVNIENASTQLASYLIKEGGANRPTYPKTSQPVEKPSNDTGNSDSEYVHFSSNVNLNAITEGSSFRVTWRLKNNGETTWQPDFQVLLVEGRLQDSPSHFTFGDVATSTPVEPGQEVDITLILKAASANPNVYKLTWRLATTDGAQFGTRFWLRYISVHGEKKQPPIRIATGININPDTPHSNPMERNILKGLDWVRFPFKAADKNRTIAQSFGEYDPIIASYSRLGIGTLLVLNQQTVAGEHAPWKNKRGKWSSYAIDFAAAVSQVAEHYAHLGDRIAYEIWNEGDNPQTPHVSVHVSSRDYATLLEGAASAIRRSAPEAPIIVGGLSTGPEDAAEYMQQVRRKLGGELPVNAIGLHPYGRWARRRPFAGWGYGDLEKVFTIFKQRLPDIPLWITEIGIVGRQHPIPNDSLPAVADYMRDLYQNIALDHSHQVRAVIWFAWSDHMENAGIVTADGRPKQPLMKAFKEIRDRRLPGL